VKMLITFLKIINNTKIKKPPESVKLYKSRI